MSSKSLRLAKLLASTDEEIQAFLEQAFNSEAHEVRLAAHKDYPHWEVYNNQTGRFEFICSAPAEVWLDKEGNWLMIATKYLTKEAV